MCRYKPFRSPRYEPWRPACPVGLADRRPLTSPAVRPVRGSVAREVSPRSDLRVGPSAFRTPGRRRRAGDLCGLPPAMFAPSEARIAALSRVGAAVADAVLVAVVVEEAEAEVGVGGDAAGPAAITGLVVVVPAEVVVVGVVVLVVAEVPVVPRN